MYNVVKYVCSTVCIWVTFPSTVQILIQAEINWEVNCSEQEQGGKIFQVPSL